MAEEEWLREREWKRGRTEKKNRTPTPPQPKPQSHNGNAVPGTEKNSPPLNRPFTEFRKTNRNATRARAFRLLNTPPL